MTHKPLRDWHGIKTNDEGRVKFIHLSENNLNGTIPSEIGSLDSAIAIALGINEISGELPPEIGSMSNLEYLHIYDTQLSGTLPAELGNLSELRSIFINDNELTGAIPSELTNLKKLFGLHFGGNDGLCAPTDSVFQEWYNQIETNANNHRRLRVWYEGVHGPKCDEGLE